MEALSSCANCTTTAPIPDSFNEQQITSFADLFKAKGDEFIDKYMSCIIARFVEKGHTAAVMESASSLRSYKFRRKDGQYDFSFDIYGLPEENKVWFRYRRITITGPGEQPVLLGSCNAQFPIGQFTKETLVDYMGDVMRSIMR